MEQVLALDVPVKVDLKYGKNWSQMQEIAYGSVSQHNEEGQ
jgi:hypothetical protein